MRGKLFILGAAAGSLTATMQLSVAAPPTMITLDGSLGHAAGPVSPTSPGFYAITPSMGKTVGSNIFQSFGTFNLGTGDTADFVANAGTQNIIARVTGGSASSIDGTITSTVGLGGPVSSANLFLLNPAGIMFTAHASLNLTGAFAASTANYVKMSDGTIFYAETVHPINDAGLGSAPISAFGFMPAAGQAPASISFVGTVLVNTGGIHVIAGDITLDQGAALLVPGNNLTLFSAASAGEVPFNVATPGAGFANATTPSFGTITIQNQSEAIAGGLLGNGNVVIRGGHLVVNNATVAATTTEAVPGGNVAIQAVSITVENGAAISDVASGAGNGGNISIEGTSLSIDGASVAGDISSVFTRGLGTGVAGSVNIALTGALSVTNGAQVTTTTSGTGGGALSITAASLTIDGSSPLFGNASTIEALGSNGATSGPINLDVTGALDLTDGATISSNSAAGSEGPITISAGSFLISGEAPSGIDSGIYSATLSSATGGTVNIDVAGAMTMLAGGNISVETFADGTGGNVVLRAGSLSIDGEGLSGLDSGIYTGSVNGANGNSGTVDITVAGAVSLTHGGTISANSEGSGTGGNITVSGGSLAVSGEDPNGFVSSITSLAESSGDGGTVRINVAGPAFLLGGGNVSADAAGSGNGGDIFFNAKDLQLSGSSIIFGDQSAIASDNTGSGQGGVIVVDVTGAMSVTAGAEVSANTIGGGDAGNVTVKAGELTVSGVNSEKEDSSISSRAKGNGNSGVIVVDVPTALRVEDGAEITADSGSISNGGSGNAGSVTINAGQVEVAGTDRYRNEAAISSGAFGTGNGGLVQITGGGVVLSNYGQVDALSLGGNAGNIVIRASDLTMLGHGAVNTEAANDGGSIRLLVSDLFYVDGGVIDSAAFGGAGTRGGNVTIEFPLLSAVNDGLIFASDPGGVGGNVLLLTGDFFVQSSEFAATGAITLTSPDLDLSGSLLPLPIALVDDEKRLRETCARSVNHEYSTLTVVGRGGTESSPDELQPDFGL